MATSDSIQYPVRTCSVHDLEELTVYCKDCTLAICIRCCREDHLSHQVEGIAKYARDVRSRIPDICHKIRSEKLLQMTTEVKSLQDLVQKNAEVCEEECATLDKMQDTLVGSVTSLFDKEKEMRRGELKEYNDGMISQQKFLGEAIELVEKRCRLLEEARHDHSNHEIIEMEAQLNNHANQHSRLEDSKKYYHPKLQQVEVEKAINEFKKELERIIIGKPHSLPPRQREKGSSERLADFSFPTILQYIDKENLTILAHTFKGEFGRGKYKRSSDATIPVTLKILPDTYRQDEFSRDMKFMCQMNHKHVLRVLGVCNAPREVYVNFENFSLDQGSLRKFLREHRSFPLSSIVLFMWQVIQGMIYLHKHRIIHRSLMLPGIWFSKDGTVQLAFGVNLFPVQLKEGEDCHEATEAGNWPLKWLSPECVYYWKFTWYSDVWSFGVVLWEALSYGETPYKGMNGNEILKFLFEEDRRLPKPQGCPEDIYQIMLECWQYKAYDRPRFTDLAEALEKEYFALMKS